MGVILVTHNFGVVADICDRSRSCRTGRIVETAPAAQLFADPQHEYTRMLLASTLEDAAARTRRWSAPSEPQPQPSTSRSAAADTQRRPLLDDRRGRRRVPGQGLAHARRSGRCTGVSLTIGAGETVGLVGESGSGKTTLGRAILGLAPVTGGEIRFEGRVISAPRHARAAGAEPATSRSSSRTPTPR